MMMAPTKEEIELGKRIDETTDIEEKRELIKKRLELFKKRNEELADCPFAH